MKVAIIYGSTHGRTKTVVSRVVQHLDAACDIFNVAELASADAIGGYELLLFFSPTYGDEELQSDMEDFLRRLDLDLSGKRFVLCELGSYYGYDDFSFGAARILRKELTLRGGVEFCEGLSLDSFPRVDWQQLSHWIDFLNRMINERGCSHAESVGSEGQANAFLQDRW